MITLVGRAAEMAAETSRLLLGRGSSPQSKQPQTQCLFDKDFYFIAFGKRPAAQMTVSDSRRTLTITKTQ